MLSFVSVPPQHKSIRIKIKTAVVPICWQMMMSTTSVTPHTHKCTQITKDGGNEHRIHRFCSEKTVRLQNIWMKKQKAWHWYTNFFAIRNYYFENNLKCNQIIFFSLSFDFLYLTRCIIDYQFGSMETNKYKNNNNNNNM